MVVLAYGYDSTGSPVPTIGAAEVPECDVYEQFFGARHAEHTRLGTCTRIALDAGVIASQAGDGCGVGHLSALAS